jgi:hypothetical protein
MVPRSNKPAAKPLLPSQLSDECPIMMLVDLEVVRRAAAKAASRKAKAAARKATAAAQKAKALPTPFTNAMF